MFLGMASLDDCGGFVVVNTLALYNVMYALHIQIRIEDDIVVTANSMELLTNVPCTMEEVEAWIQRGEKSWTPPTPAS